MKAEQNASFALVVWKQRNLYDIVFELVLGCRRSRERWSSPFIPIFSSQSCFCVRCVYLPLPWRRWCSHFALLYAENMIYGMFAVFNHESLQFWLPILLAEWFVFLIVCLGFFPQNLSLWCFLWILAMLSLALLLSLIISRTFAFRWPQFFSFLCALALYRVLRISCTRSRTDHSGYWRCHQFSLWFTRIVLGKVWFEFILHKRETEVYLHY